MKKAAVKVGARYEVKIAGKVQVVVVTAYDGQRGKFEGRNEKTGRTITGDFRRLRREVEVGKTLMDGVFAGARTRGDGSRS